MKRRIYSSPSCGSVGQKINAQFCSQVRYILQGLYNFSSCEIIFIFICECVWETYLRLLTNHNEKKNPEWLIEIHHYQILAVCLWLKGWDEVDDWVVKWNDGRSEMGSVPTGEDPNPSLHHSRWTTAPADPTLITVRFLFRRHSLKRLVSKPIAWLASKFRSLLLTNYSY